MSINSSRKRAGTTTATAPPPSKHSNHNAGDDSTCDPRSSGKAKKKSNKNGKGKKGARAKISDDPMLEADGIEIMEDDAVGGSAKTTGGGKKNKSTMEEVEDEGDGGNQPAKTKPLTREQEEEKLHKLIISYESQSLSCPQSTLQKRRQNRPGSFAKMPDQLCRHSEGTDRRHFTYIGTTT